MSLCHVGVVGYFDSEHRVWYVAHDSGWTEKQKSARLFLSEGHAEQFAKKPGVSDGSPMRGGDPLLVIPFGSSREEIMAIHREALKKLGEEEVDDFTPLV